MWSNFYMRLKLLAEWKTCISKKINHKNQSILHYTLEIDLLKQYYKDYIDN